MKKVCFLIPTIDAGGIETYVLRFIRYSAGRLNITVVVRNGKRRGELLDDYMKTGVELRFMSLGYINIVKMRNYLHFFKSQKFDTVCDFNGNFSGETLFLAKISGIDNRVAFYRSSSNHFKNTILNNVFNFISNKLVQKFATNILANSLAGLKFFFTEKKVQKDDRFQVIKNGIEQTTIEIKADKSLILQELNIPENNFIIAHSGRFDKSKNHLSMLEVAGKVISKNPNIYFLFCGRNTEQLQSLVNQFNISKNVRLLGYRNDVLKIVKNSDLFFFPSITEGQPNALIEALMMGKPIVASNIEAIKECLPESLYNRLAEPYDIDGFVSLIENTFKSPHESDYSNWAKKEFSASVNFEKFFRYL